MVNSEPLAVWLISSGANRRRARFRRRSPCAAVRCAMASREWIVRIQDRPSRSAQRPRRASPFSCAIASRDPMNSMCAMPMLVMMATSGARQSRRAARFRRDDSCRSPRPRLRRSRWRRSIVCGRPTWLLKLPSVFVTRKRRARTAAVKSLVLVLPLLPVMRDDFQRQRLPIIRRQISGKPPACRPRAGARKSGAAFRRSNSPPRSRRRRRAARPASTKRVAVEILAAQRDEEFARLERARVGADAAITSRSPCAGRRSDAAGAISANLIEARAGPSHQNSHRAILRARAARPGCRRTARCGRRIPGKFRGLCRRSERCRAAAPARWRA